MENSVINVFSRLLKLKSKFFQDYPKSAVFFALAALLGGGFLFAAKAFAVNFPVNNVVIQTDTVVNGKKDNLIRMVKGGTASFSVDLTIVSATADNNLPANQIMMGDGKDTFDFKTTTGGRRDILGFGVGLEPYGEGNKCETKELFSLLSSNKEFLSCPFSGGANKSPTPAFQGNKVLVGTTYRYTFNLNSSILSKLNLNPNSTSTSPQSFAVYPYFDIDVALTFDPQVVAFTDASKQMFVQIFADQKQLEQAVASNTRPNIPAYGSNTGNANVKNSASALLSFINQIISFLFGLLQELIYATFYLIVAPILESVLSIHVYTDSFVAIIYPGWVVIRNFANMTFIIALIAIGMTTMFRIESYQFRHLIVQLIIAALLVNFSLLIAQAILGIADTVQAQFLGNNIAVTRSLAQNLMLQGNSSVWNYINGIKNNNAAAVNGSFSGLVQPFFWLALSLGSLFVFGAIVAYLIIRIVALWILLMVSPIAYVAGVLPATHHYQQEWWNNFLKYAFFTPIMAFFLNMTAVMVDNAKNNPIFTKILSGETQLGGLAGFITTVASDILLLLFLLVGLKFAEQFGIYGAHAINDIAKKGIGAPFKAAGWGIKTYGRYLNRRKQEKTMNWQEKTQPWYKKMGFVIANPKTYAKAISDRGKAKRERAQHDIEVAAKDLLKRTPFFKSAGPLDLPHARLHAAEEEGEKLRIGSESQGIAYLTTFAKAGANKGNIDNQNKMLGVFLSLVKSKGMNTILSEADNIFGLKKGGYKANTEGLIEFMHDFQKAGYVDKNLAGDLMAEISRIGGDTRQYWLMEAFKLHDNHPVIIETDGSGNVVGKLEYENFINTAMRKMRDGGLDRVANSNAAEFIRAAESQGKVFTDEEKQKISSQMFMNEFKKVKDELRKNMDNELKEKVHNYEAYVEGKAIRDNNEDKIGSRERWMNMHFNNFTFWNGTKWQATNLGIHRLANLTEGDFAQSDQIDPKKLETITMAVADRSQFESDLEKYYKERNPHLSDAEVKIWAEDKIKMAQQFVAGNKNYLKNVNLLKNFQSNIKAILDRENNSSKIRNIRNMLQQQVRNINFGAINAALEDKLKDSELTMKPDDLSQEINNILKNNGIPDEKVNKVYSVMMGNV